MRRTELKRKTLIKRRPFRRKSKKAGSLSALKKKAWSLLSKAIRLEHRDSKGCVTCVSCKVSLPWNRGLQAGHFIDGRFNSILFDERGIHPQCYACNVIYNGRKEEYFLFMESRYGRELIDELRRLRNTERKFSAEELEGLIAGYRLRIAIALKKMPEKE